MRPTEEPLCPWGAFQLRITQAILTARKQHWMEGGLLSTEEKLFFDLAECIVTLRDEDASLDELDQPAANEIAAALEKHAEEDDVYFGEAGASNIAAEIAGAIIDCLAEEANSP